MNKKHGLMCFFHCEKGFFGLLLQSKPTKLKKHSDENSWVPDNENLNSIGKNYRNNKKQK